MRDTFPALLIYGIVDGPGALRYVGRTRYPASRLRQHQLGACWNTADLVGPIRMVALDVLGCGEDETFDERAWITFASTRAHLLNLRIPRQAPESVGPAPWRRAAVETRRLRRRFDALCGGAA